MLENGRFVFFEQQPACREMKQEKESEIEHVEQAIDDVKVVNLSLGDARPIANVSIRQIIELSIALLDHPSHHLLVPLGKVLDHVNGKRVQDLQEREQNGPVGLVVLKRDVDVALAAYLDAVLVFAGRPRRLELLGRVGAHHGAVLVRIGHMRLQLETLLPLGAIHATDYEAVYEANQDERDDVEEERVQVLIHHRVELELMQ